MLEYEGIKIELLDDVYPPEEDTLMFLEVLKKEEFGKEEALEIGCGCGILSLYLTGRVRHVTGVDINEKAVELSKKNAGLNEIRNVTFFISDMFSKIEGTFDITLFNPPYLPVTEPLREAIDLSYHGGQDGRLLTLKFLKSFPDYLDRGGRAYLLQSSVSGIKDTLDFLGRKGYKTKILSQKDMMFEKLVVLRVMV